jgi:hypothetical protein
MQRATVRHIGIYTAQIKLHIGRLSGYVGLDEVTSQQNHSGPVIRVNKEESFSLRTDNFRVFILIYFLSEQSETSGFPDFSVPTTYYLIN